MRVVFGKLTDNSFNATMELDGTDHAISITPTIINIAELCLKRSIVNMSEITAIPTPGQFWEPRFATSIHIMRQANAASIRKVGNDESVDIGEVVDMAARHSMSDEAATILNVDSSYQKPPVAAGQINGAQLRDLLRLPTIATADRPQLVNQALVPSTVSEHNRMLTKLQDMPESCHRLPLPIAIATYLWQESVQHQWKPTTLFKYLCTAQGALRILPLYRASSPSLILSNDPIWSMVMRGARQAAVEHIPAQPKAATHNDIIKALKATTGFYKKHVRVIIMLAWLTTSRLGCIRKLKSEDFHFNATKKTMDITFRRGKGVRARKQAYTVTTLIMGQEWWKEIVNYVKERPGFLFPASLKDSAITTPLKKAGIEQRSIRRGALQAMAADKVAPETLMNFSGHTSINTLNRYLDFGKKRADLSSTSTAAARSLWNNDLLDEAWDEDLGALISSSS
jgi:hypothetical protein